MFISPYDTLACSRHRISPILASIKSEEASGVLRKSPVGGGRNKILLVTQDNKSVPPFAHPIITKDLILTRGDSYAAVIDARGVTRINRETGVLMPTSDFIFAENRAFLSLVAWAEGNSRDLLTLGDLPMRVFSAILSENVGRRDNLTPETIEYLRVVAAYFYIGLHYDSLPVDEVSIGGYSRVISRAVSIPIPVVESIIKEMPHLTDLERYTVVISTSGVSERLSRYNAGMLINWLGGMWFGPNAAEVAAVALEHPPTFVAMLYSSVIDNSFRKTMMRQITDRIDRKGELGATFIKNMRNLQRMEI